MTGGAQNISSLAALALARVETRTGDQPGIRGSEIQSVGTPSTDY